MVVQKKQRRVSDSVLPSLGLRRNSGVSARGGHLASSSTYTSPHPWAVINFDIFWVLLGPNTRCADRLSKECGPKSTNGASNTSRNTCHTCHNCKQTNGHVYTKCCPQGQQQHWPSSSCKQTENNDGCVNYPKEGQTLPSFSSLVKNGYESLKNSREGEDSCPPYRKDSNGRNEKVDGDADDTWDRPPHLHGTDSRGIVSRDKTSGEKSDVVEDDGSVWCASQGVGGVDGDGGRLYSQEEEEEEEKSISSSKPSGGVGREGGGPPRPSPCSCSCCCCCCSCSTMHQVRNIKKEARQLRAGDMEHREGSQVKGATMRVAGDGFSAHRSAMTEQQQRQTKTSAGTINQESSRKAAKSGITIVKNNMCAQQSSSMSASQNNVKISGFQDLDNLNTASQPGDITNAIMRYSGVMSSFVDQLKALTVNDAPSLLENIDEMMRRAWSVPTYGHELGFSLCNVLRNNGGMDILLDNCRSDDSDLKFSSAKVLEQCLTTENRGYVVENGLENVVNVACDCTRNGSSVDKSRVGTGILEHLFKHSEGTCSDIIQLGGLDAVLSECRKSDVETLRHCAGALANLSLYGGSDNQQAMIQRKVPMWLFPLAFHSDDNIKYYACLAIAALVANKELEAAVLQSGTLNLVEPFVMNQIPDQFANSTVAHRHGQSHNWLLRLLPVLRSKREEARNLAAFHFCMEAGIKKRQGNIELFRDIGAVEPLKEVASSPNAIASKYAVQALRLIGEEVPHKLSQQVPLWTPEDVKEWVKQCGFSQFGDDFVNSRVDGDLLLQLVEENLREDIGMKNGILRQRFMRELRKLKLLADYSSCDSTRLNEFMVEVDKEFAEYTYCMLRAGVTREWMRCLSEEQLISECGIYNSIHRQRIRDAITNDSGQLQDASSLDKTLDVFISYRRSNGSQLASLLKVHMQLKEFSVFIDVERLEAGKFDNNLLNSIRQAKNFLLVLTPNALDRCIGDNECKDWVHREIVAALQSGCNIIPIIDNFQWPDPEELPEDMRAVCYFNGVRWIHDYQDACVDKMERFMRGECNVRGDGPLAQRVGKDLHARTRTPKTDGATLHWLNIGDY
ncbi:hypothetical protein Pmani_020660 [Petrolisthes manimaculis]|uniref:ADP-ribosyl cyclase/cyclic ADP-ribose hydrolase n=1 Tax=Petrolisthes manimaculis TaxID=1843537 RepID=A0AAE1PG97_9EUCA|nr:hypothetical protein Pmani_020660 [Petrolisthes manimaculis]